MRRTLLPTFATLLVLLGCFRTSIANDAPTDIANQLLTESGVQGGLIVHLGCDDGTLTAALGTNESYSVHGLDADADRVVKARAHVQSLGLYGKVTIERWSGDRLPYIDNLVNLLIASEQPAVSNDEILRILAPNGVALIGQGADRTKIVKPWPVEIDEWSHYLHDATNNAVGQDTLVGPPHHYQWIGSPQWLRHHDHMSGLSAMVSSGGRIFYLIDLGPRWSVQMPPRWTLVARDAFNGTILWQRPIPNWHPHLWPLKRGPAQLMRRLIAMDNTVYVTLGVGAPVSALDAATGETIRQFEGTEGAEELLLDDGRLFVSVHLDRDAFRSISRDSVESTRAAGREWFWDETPRKLAVFDSTTGKRLWTLRQKIAPTTLACAKGRLYFHDGEKIVCLEASNGGPVWESKPLARWNPMHVLFGPTLVVHDDVVLFAGGENMIHTRGGKDTMKGLSAETGDILWEAPHPPSGYASSEDLFVIDNLVWCGETTNRANSGEFTGRDLHTGEVKHRFPSDDWPHMPHHRCHRAKATSNYILTSRTGIEYVDFRKEHWTVHHWVRGSCNYGIMPSNGLTYAPPHSCACYPLAKLNSLNALATKRSLDADLLKPNEAERIERGTATNVSGSRVAHAEDWPTLRHDPARSGIASTSVSSELNLAWQTKLGGKLSAPVVAEGLLFVTSIDTHDLHAIDLESGKRRWTFKASGRIDSPPTVWQGRVLFGSADGHVYCLESGTGDMHWRYRAAPVDLRMTAHEQVESVWPIHGSVLVDKGVVQFVAGRSMWLDGGLRLLRLDAKSGTKLSETIMDDKFPTSGNNLQTNIQWPNLPVALPDVLSLDGPYVYMRSQPFDREGNRLDVVAPRKFTEQQGDTAHLFSPTGFLDNAWWHRSYWVYGQSFIGGAGGWYLAAYQAPAGRILCVDEVKVYGFGRIPSGFRGTSNTYHLFACDKRPKIEYPNPKQASSKQKSSVFGRRVPTRPVFDWSESVPFLARAMVVAKETLFAAGPMVLAEERDAALRHGDPEMRAKMKQQIDAFEGRSGAVLMATSTSDGRNLAAYRLPSAPVFDGMAAARGRLFVSMLDGTVLCLASGVGQPLEQAADIEPSPTPLLVDGLLETKTHPDFSTLTHIGLKASDLGYRMRSAPKHVSLALKQLETPLARRAEFHVRVRPSPGASSPDQPGNGFLAFGESPEDAQLVKCGFRISGKRIFIVQGPLMDGTSKSAAIDVKADQVAEMTVVVDLDKQTVTLTMLGESLSADIENPLDSIRWVGCCLTSVTTDFSPIEISGK